MKSFICIKVLMKIFSISSSLFLPLFYILDVKDMIMKDCIIISSDLCIR